MLLEATRSNGQPGEADWQFALRRDRLLAGGLTPTNLRVLLREGCLQQRLETTTPKNKQRRFREVHNLALADGCCFLLTARGVSLVCSVLDAASAGQSAEETVVSAEVVRPHWSARAGVLWLGKKAVRRVSEKAKSLRHVLAALEEEEWPPDGIDNPLGRTNKVSDVQRLKEVIKELNQQQLDARIDFSRDRSKTRLLWRILQVRSRPSNGKVAGGRGPRNKECKRRG